MMIEKFYNITIEELLKIKKISKMAMREAIPKMIELRDRHNFTDIEVKNLIGIAKNFNATITLIPQNNK